MTNRKPTGGSIIDTIHQKCLGPGLLSPLSLPRPPPIRPGKGGRGRRSHFVSRSTSTRHLLRRHLCLAPQPRCHSHWLIEARHVETRQHPPFPPLTAAITNTIPQRLAVLANTHLCSSPSMSIDRETVGGGGGTSCIYTSRTRTATDISTAPAGGCSCCDSRESAQHPVFYDADVVCWTTSPRIARWLEKLIESKLNGRWMGDRWS